MIPIAEIDSRVITALVVAGGLVLFGALLVLTAAGELRGRRTAKVPPGFRPAPSDEQLERRVLERYQLWGALTAIVIALWLPAYWLREPKRLDQERTIFAAEAVERGQEKYIELCSSCHGTEGQGVPRQVLLDGNETTYTEPPLAFIYARYKAAGRNEDEITQLIYDAIGRGRPGTPMPTWSLQFGGPMNSQQIDDMVSFLRSIQEPIEPDPKHPAFIASEDMTGSELFAANCAICHGTGGRGVDDNGNRTPGPNLRVALERIPIEELRRTIETGRLNTNRFSMPAWAALGSDAIDKLVSFIQSIQRSA